MIRHPARLLRRGGLGLAALALLAAPALAAHPDVALYDEAGGVINPTTSAAPYSPKQTCGACHGYDNITKGYHFQQGFDVMSDQYSASKPWILSPGMIGKW